MEVIINSLKKNYIKIIILIILSIILDNFLILKIQNPPAWDQGYHLSNVFKIYNIFENNNLNISNKVNQILNVTDSYRGPITYFFSAIFLKIFNNSYHYAYLSNQIFNILCIFSIFNLGKIIKNESTGIWAALIFTFSSFIIMQRSDYLIDLSLTSFSTLNLLFFTKWYLDNKENSKYSIFSGISLGLVFLTKPTGITLFILPLASILLKLLRNKNRLTSNINEILFFQFSFILIIYPWFSKHWLTIITSTINAWNWGINYQEGFNSKSFDSWFFYFKELPSIFGLTNFSICSILLLTEKFFKQRSLIFKDKNIIKINFWFLIYFLNCYLILSLMSTKDIRFVLPLYPLFCIYLSVFINNKESKLFTIKSKKIILIISISLSLLFNENGLISKIKRKESIYKWPHKEIIQAIKNKNLNLTSTLAVIADLKELNTFNLEAEATRQGEYVSVRQIVSNTETYKDDLQYFDWFLVKKGDQGVMVNESKILLNKYLLDNESFTIDEKWTLPDESELFLLRRKIINSNINISECTLNSPELNIFQIQNGININLIASGKLIKSSMLLIDLENKDYKYLINISLANGFFHPKFDEEKCYSLSQNISQNLEQLKSKDLFLKAKLLDKGGNIKQLKLKSNNLIIKEALFKDDYIQMANRIKKVELLGNYLNKGKFKDLFDLVGVINQSDPKQIYLKESERIFLQRYKENKDLKSLNSLLISQILQRKIIEARNTIDLLLISDPNNGNLELVRSIINIYLIDGKNARFSIEKAKLLEKSNESEDLINTIDGLTSLIEMKFINAFKILS